MVLGEFVDVEGLRLLVDAIGVEAFDLVDARVDGVGAAVLISVEEGECLVGLLESESVAGYGDELMLYRPEALALHEVLGTAVGEGVHGG